MTKLKKYIKTAIPAFLLIATPAIAEQITIHSIDFDGRQTECVQKGKEALAAAKFISIQDVGARIFANDAPYYAGIECRADKGVVFIIVSGPKESERGLIIDKIWKSF